MGKSEWFKANPYDVSMRLAQDQFLLISAHLVSRYACLDDNLLAYCIKQHSLKKSIKKRLYYTSALFKIAVAQNHLFTASFAVIRQILILMLDVIFGLLNVTEILDKKRYAPVNQIEIDIWDATRATFNITFKPEGN